MRGANVAPGRINWADQRKISHQLASQYPQYILDEGDIVLAMDRPLISSGLKISIIQASDAGSLLVQRVANPQPTELILNSYLYLAMCGPKFIHHVQNCSTGSDLPHISSNDILTASINIPPIDEQAEIVRRFDDLSRGISILESEYLSTSGLLHTLNSSILDKAFLGRLVPQRLTDEPASELMLRPNPVITDETDETDEIIRQNTSSDKMVESPKLNLLEDSKHWPEQGLSFEDLAKRHSFKNDVMRDALFGLMTGEAPKIKQSFNKETQCMHILRAYK